MKPRIGLMAIVVLFLLPAAAASRAQAETLNVKVAGVQQDGDINNDPNYPDNHSYASSGVGQTSSGRHFTWNGNIEYSYNPISPAANCPAGDIEYTEFAGGVIVLTFIDTSADQLVLQIGPSSYECATPDLSSAHDTDTGTVIGGRGAFANATGTFNWQASGGVLVTDPAGHLFGDGTGTAVIDLGGSADTIDDSSDSSSRPPCVCRLGHKPKPDTAACVIYCDLFGG
jgi:hypothetical protein